MALRKSPHPGVKLLTRRRKGGVTYFARVQQLDGSWRDVSLTKEGIRSARDRRRWAQEESDRLAAKRLAMATRRLARATSPEEAVRLYLEDAERRLKPLTLVSYRREAAALRRWLEERGVDVVEVLESTDLWRLRGALQERARAPRTLARWLRTAQAVVTWWRRQGLVPLLDSDAVNDALKPDPIPDSPPVVYSRLQLRMLLAAAVALGPEAAKTVALYLLLGTRYSELEALTWDLVDLEAPPGGVLRIGRPSKRGAPTKTKRSREVDLSVTPGARAILESLPRDSERVCPWLRGAHSSAWRYVRPLRKALPGWTWQHLRETCASYQACAPGVWGSAAPFRTARQLGHSIAVCERHYLGTVRGIDPGASTIEGAMGVADLVEVVSRL